MSVYLWINLQSWTTLMSLFSFLKTLSVAKVICIEEIANLLEKAIFIFCLFRNNVCDIMIRVWYWCSQIIISLILFYFYLSTRHLNVSLNTNSNILEKGKNLVTFFSIIYKSQQSQLALCSVFKFFDFWNLEKMENNSVVKYVFNPPDTLELASGDENQPKHDKDSVYFKVNIGIFRSLHCISSRNFLSNHKKKKINKSIGIWWNRW